MLAKALRDNPDVRLAAAKLAEAAAELNKARLSVVQKVASQYQAVEAQKAAVDGAAAELEETKAAYKAASVSKADMRAAEQKLIDAKAKLAQLEAELPYLLGEEAEGKNTTAALLGAATRPPRPEDAELMRHAFLDIIGRAPTLAEAAAFGPDGKLYVAVQGPTADRIRAALDKPFTYNGKDIVLSEIIKKMSEALQIASQGLVIKDAAHDVTNVNGVSVDFDNMPLGATLEWVEDTLPNYRFYVRDYGLVFAARDQAPPGAPLLHDFWKGAKAEDKAGTKESSPKIPNIEGKINAIRPDGQVVLNIGGDAGVRVGDQFEAYLPGKTPGTDVNMGPIRVTEVKPTQSVAQVIGALMTAPKEGWRVVRIDHNN